VKGRNCNVYTSDHVPVRSPRRLVAPSGHVLLQTGIVEHSSNYTGPAFLVPKGGGDFHMVVLVDYRTQNEAVVCDSSPLPDLERAFDCFLGMRDFSVLDTNSACYLIALSPRSRRPLWFVRIRKSSCRSCIGLHVLSRKLTDFSETSVSNSCLITLTTCWPIPVRGRNVFYTREVFFSPGCKPFVSTWTPRMWRWGWRRLIFWVM
jgi:hypothetical protein